MGIWRPNGLQGIADDLGGDSAQRALLAQELHAIVVISSERAETLLQSDDAGYAASINADRKITSARSEEVRKRLEALAADPYSRELFAAIDAAGNEFRAIRNKLVKRKEAGEKIPSDEIHSTLRPAADGYASAVEALARYQARRVAEARTAASSSAHEGVTMLAAGAVLGGLLSLWCAWSLSRSIVGPLAEVSQRAALVAAGDLRAPLVADRTGRGIDRSHREPQAASVAPIFGGRSFQAGRFLIGPRSALVKCVRRRRRAGELCRAFGLTRGAQTSRMHLRQHQQRVSWL